MAHAVSVAPSVSPILATVRSTLATFQEARKRRADFRKTVNELQSLSNRELADLGLARSAIRGIAYEHAYGK